MSDPPIVIGNFYRSGSSLLRRLLDAHSRIHCGPEVKFFKDFYGDYQDDGLAGVRLFASARAYGLPEAELLALFGEAFVAFHRRAAALAGKPRWADKSPDNVLYLAQWRSLLPEGFQFIHVVRHPLDALASLKEVGFARAVPPAFADKARLYKVYRDAGEAYCAAQPQTSVTLAYEDLVREPELTLRGLFEALGEKFEPEVLETFHLSARRRGVEDPKVWRTRAVHADSVGRWRSTLSAEEVAVAREILGPIAQGLT